MTDNEPKFSAEYVRRLEALVTPQRHTFTFDVDIDPTWHGHDLSDAEKRDIVLASINARPGLEVVPTNTTPPGASLVQ